MNEIWEFMQKSKAHGRHHIIAIVRAMAAGETNRDLGLSPDAVDDLKNLGLEVTHVNKAVHNVRWAEDKTPVCNEWERYVKQFTNNSVNKNGIGRVGK